MVSFLLPSAAGGGGRGSQRHRLPGDYLSASVIPRYLRILAYFDTLVFLYSIGFLSSRLDRVRLFVIRRTDRSAGVSPSPMRFDTTFNSARHPNFPPPSGNAGGVDLLPSFPQITAPVR